MKRLISKIFFVAFGAIALVSCNLNDPTDGTFGDDPNSGWVQFENNVPFIAVSGLTTEFDVPFTLMAPVNTEGLLVNFTITDVQGSSAGFLTHTGVGEVPKNTRNGKLHFSIPNTELTTCREFLITLTTTSRANVSVGLNNGTEKQITRRLIIGKGISSFLGAYTVIEDETYTYTSIITAGDAPNELRVSNVYGENPASQTSVFIEPASVGGLASFGPYLGNEIVPNVFASGLDEQSEDWKVDFTNYFDSCSNSLNLFFKLIDSDEGEVEGSDAAPINIVLTKN